MNILIAIVIILHGLVHLWYVTMSQGWVELKPEMGWNGHSWLLSNMAGANLTATLASVFFGLSALLFVIAGAGLLAGAAWARPWMIAAAAVSTLSILLFWDGRFNLIVEKGLIGLLLSAGLLVAELTAHWPAA